MAVGEREFSFWQAGCGTRMAVARMYIYAFLMTSRRLHKTLSALDGSFPGRRVGDKHPERSAQEADAHLLAAGGGGSVPLNAAFASTFVPQGYQPPVPQMPQPTGPPSEDVIARAKQGAMSVLEKINQVSGVLLRAPD